MVTIHGISILLLIQLTQGQFGDLFSPIPAPSPMKGHWEIHTFDNNTNLRNRYIVYADFDEDENLWVATSSGLYRFDGFEWREFTTQDGLPTNFIRCVLWTDQGLMVGTANGVGIFDWQSKSFDTFGSENHLPSQQIRRIVQDPDGTLWFCCDRWPRANTQGGLTKYQNGKWKTYTSDDGLPINYVQNYFRSAEGRQFVLTSKGAAEKQGERWVHIIPENRGEFWDAAEKDGVLFLAGNNAVFMQDDEEWKKITLSEIPQKYVLHQTNDGSIFTSVLVDSKSRQLFEWDGNKFEPVSPTFFDGDIQNDHIEQILQSPDQSIWIIGPDHVQSWQPQQNEWIAYSTLPPPVNYDWDGRVWFSDASRTVVKDGERWLSSPTIYQKIKKDREGNLWTLSEEGLTYWNQYQFIHYTVSDLGLNRFIYYYIDQQNSVWIVGEDTFGTIVVKTLNEKRWNTFSHPLLQQLAFVGGAPNKDGIFLVLEKGDIDYQILKINHSTTEELFIPHQHKTVYNRIELYATDHFLWYFGTTGLHRLNRITHQWKEFEDSRNLKVHMGMTSEDAVWFSAQELNDRRGMIVSINKNNEVITFPGINVYATNNTNPNELLFGSKGSMYLISENTSWKPHHVSIPINSKVQGIIGTHNDIWLRVNNLTLHYKPNRLHPRPYINGSNVEVHQHQSIELQFQSKRKFVPNVSDHEYQYSWSLDGGQWSEYTYQDELLFNAEELSVGKHRLMLHSMSSNFKTSLQPAVYSFTVLPEPLQQRAWFLYAVICLILLFSLLSIIAFMSRHQYRRLANHLEDEVESRTFELQQSKDQLQGLSQRLISIREEEQTRIARDLHDDLGHSLTSLKMELNKLAKHITQHDGRKLNHLTSLDQLGNIGNIVNNTVKSVRRICTGLRPTMLDNLGLIPTIQWEAEQFTLKSNIQCELELPVSISLSSTQSTTLYRILQESLTNIARHSEADLVKISLQTTESQIEMVIQDNGKGIDDTDSNQHQSNGLIGIQERTRMIGGYTVFTSEPGKGMTVEVNIPKN